MNAIKYTQKTYKKRTEKYFWNIFCMKRQESRKYITFIKLSLFEAEEKRLVFLTCHMQNAVECKL